MVFFLILPSYRMSSFEQDRLGVFFFPPVYPLPLMHSEYFGWYSAPTGISEVHSLGPLDGWIWSLVLQVKLPDKWSQHQTTITLCVWFFSAKIHRMPNMCSLCQTCCIWQGIYNSKKVQRCNTNQTKLSVWYTGAYLLSSGNLDKKNEFPHFKFATRTSGWLV